jgi:hypothetical protein
MRHIRHDNCYMSTSKILTKGSGSVFLIQIGFGVAFSDSKRFGVVLPDEVLTSKPELISSINPKYFDYCFIILIKFL